LQEVKTVVYLQSVKRGVVVPLDGTQNKLPTYFDDLMKTRVES